MKRLEKKTGEIISGGSDQSDSQIIRPAILVHSAPEGKKITFMSADGEISFDDARINLIAKNHNAKINNLANGYGGIDKMPIGAFPPILDQHENNSNDKVIGRLASLIRVEKRNVPGIGDNVTCAIADITFLGRGTVEKVKDGRIYHLSIGIDEATNTLGETSAVIEPAAPGAMLLKKGRDMTNKRLTKLNEIKESLTNLVKGVAEKSELVKLTKKQGDITHRLTGLMRSGKLTPAESKKFDVKKLAKLDDDSLNTIIESYELREPVIMPGQIGTSDAAEFSEIGKALGDKKIKKLKSETLKDFKRLGVKLKDGVEIEDEKEEDKEHGGNVQMAEEEKRPEGDAAAVHAKHLEHLATMKKHLEEGKIEEAKKHLYVMDEHAKELAKHLGCGVKHMELGDVKSEDYKASMESLQKQIDELNTQMARVGGMVDELINVEKEEGELLKEESKQPDAELPAEHAKVAEEHKSLEEEVKKDINNEGAGLK